MLAKKKKVHSLFIFPFVKRKNWVGFKLKKIINLFLNSFLVSYSTGIKIFRVLLRNEKKRKKKVEKKRIPAFSGFHTRYMSSSFIIICFHKKCWIAFQGGHPLFINMKLLFWNWGAGRFINPRFLILGNPTAHFVFNSSNSYTQVQYFIKSVLNSIHS